MLKKAVVLSLLAVVSFMGSCEEEADDGVTDGGANTYTDPFTQGGLTVDPTAKTITLSATFQRANAEAGTWHFLVHREGEMSPMAIFATSVTPHQYYSALKELGAADGNNVNPDNLAEPAIATDGSAVSTSITWAGAPKAYPVSEFLTEVVPQTAADQTAKGIDFKFGGNRTNEDWPDPPSDTTGCLMCLYSCKAGVVSNAAANLNLVNTDTTTQDVYRYRVDPAVAPADRTEVTIVLTVS